MNRPKMPSQKGNDPNKDKNKQQLLKTERVVGAGECGEQGDFRS